MKRFAFIMDPLEALDLPWDTSLCLLRELNRRGHQNIHFLASSLSLSFGEVKGWGRLICPLGGNRYTQGEIKKYDLGDFDVVLIRQDPPFDSNYLALTYLLEPLARKTSVINHPQGIRNANEKIWGLSAAKASPPTMVTAHLKEILAFQESMESDLVVKPLYEKGGKGVFLLRRKGRKNIHLLQKATRKGKDPVVVQKFIPLSQGQGDKRILLWKGKVLGAFARIPKAGEFRSNLSLGGHFVAASPTPKERRLVQDLQPLLLKEGLFFVGIDVREEKLIEVNVTSPAGLVELDSLYGHRVIVKLADALESL